VESFSNIEDVIAMTPPENAPKPVATTEEIQSDWHELTARVGMLEVERTVLEQEIKGLRFILERVIEHRQKSHGELVLILSGLVSKLPLNDIGAIVAKLVEHNSHVNEVLAALLKGKADASLPQPTILRALEQNKRDMAAALKTAVEQLIQLDTPFEKEMLQSLIEKPELFFSPSFVRANRGFVKGQIPRERIVKEFGEESLVFFNDMTTDAKLNPRPKPEEIALAFKSDFEAVFQQNPNVVAAKRQELLALYQRMQRSKTAPEQARAQRHAFQKLSFILEVLHYYDNQNTEAPDVIFAQRLPSLVEQLALPDSHDRLDEKLILEAEHLLAFVVHNDYRQAIVNNMGKGGGIARTLRFVLALRNERLTDAASIIPEFVKHLVPPAKVPSINSVTAILRLLKPEMQRLVVNAIRDYDKLRKEDADALGKAVGKELGLTGLDEVRKAPDVLSVEIERKLAWEKVKDMIARRLEPGLIAGAIRTRLHAKYDADEMKQSWVILSEADPISFIRVFCQLPYLADGTTDPVARAVMETYVTRLTHEKYAAAYNKVLTSLKNMFKANPNSPTLVNFLALVRWLDHDAANKISNDIGMPVMA
jgi:hypothetical protein